MGSGSVLSEHSFHISSTYTLSMDPILGLKFTFFFFFFVFLYFCFISPLFCRCDFFNYGRNMTCLRCDCKRPGESSFGSMDSSSGVGYCNGRFANNKVDIDIRFSKISQLDSTSSDMTSAIGDEDFPEIMPLRKGVNRFVVNTRKTPLERRLGNAQYRRNLGNDGSPEGDSRSGGSNDTLDTSVSKSLDEILGRSSGVSGSESRPPPPFSGSASSHYGHPKGFISFRVVHNGILIVYIKPMGFISPPEPAEEQGSPPKVWSETELKILTRGQEMGAKVIVFGLTMDVHIFASAQVISHP